MRRQPSGRDLWRKHPGHLREALTIAIATALPCAPTHAQKAADTYPTKPIRVVVPLAPGGGADLYARVLAPRLSEAFGKPVVIDNRTGGGGMIGHEIAVRAVPDGYTVAVTSASYAANAALFKLPYDPISDITPLALIGQTGWMLVVHPSVPAKSTRELIALAKANPGTLNYGSSGTGGVTHLASELFGLMANAQLTHVPYKSTGTAISDLVGGQLQVIFGGVPPMMGMYKAGRVRAIAVTTARRVASVPDIPTIGETVPGYEATLWYGSFGPKGLPPDIARRWNSEIAKALTAPAIRERMAEEGVDPGGGPPDQLLNALKDDVLKWGKVVRAANVKVIQ
ncbi:MAG: Bug family tripartite tricarboxylate transporter substrate binding protein [Burkholderiales bacterium]